jgi:murein L,D-transpeptidase YafK
VAAKTLQACLIAVLSLWLASPVLASSGEVDQMLSSSLADIQANRLDLAQDKIDRLLALYPNFRVAQLLKGDLLLARIQPLSTLGNASANNETLRDLRAEAQVRLKNLAQPIDPTWIPREVMALSVTTPYLLVVDASKSRLFVFSNKDGELRRVTDYYITVGKFGTGKNREGDKRTPIGLYTITAHKADDTLDELYGVGAYPLNYPNEWDKRQGKTGHGIWLHGVPRSTYSRPPKASDGCVVLSNDDVVSLGRHIDVGKTPVFIAQNLNWGPAEAARNIRDSLESAMQDWTRDWSSRDTSKLMQHYSRDLNADGADYTAFAQQKARVNAGKSWIEVDITDLSLFLQPDNPDLAVATFTQKYRSNNLQDSTVKRQYWRREAGQWRIFNETSL